MIIMIIIITIIIIIIIIINTYGLEILGWQQLGVSLVSWAGAMHFSRGWQSPRDAVSMKIMVMMQP